MPLTFSARSYRLEPHENGRRFEVSGAVYFGVVLEKPKRQKKPKLPWPAVDVPHQCTILTVDPGKVSGWCLWSRGRIIDSNYESVIANSSSIDDVFDQFLKEDGPHVLVVERPFGSKFGTASSGTGAGDVMWREKAKLRKIRAIVRVFPNSWRSKALPPGWAGIAKRGEIRKEEERVALELLKEGFPEITAIHSDIAPAVCMTTWAARSGEVLEKLMKLPKRIRAQAGL